MARVTIRMNSEADEYGIPLRDTLQRIAEAHEGYCGHILGDPDQLKAYHQEIMQEIPNFLSIVLEMGELMDQIYNL